ncbi:MAG: alpha/beta hydrolase [Bacteroidota bacterium]
MKHYLFLLCIVFFSCQKESETGNTNLPEKILPDVSYGSNALQNMDIYLPAGRTSSSTKVLILIHGGGWNSGDKTDFESYVDTLKKRLPGFAIFNINYRLASGTSNLFPTQEMDVKAAVEFISSRANEYNISQKIGLVGVSAGAHLCLLQAYKYSNIKIKAVVDFFGPTDLADMYNYPASFLASPAALAAIIGATPVTNPAIYQQSSPINFVSAQSPPTIILQGGVDILVAPSQSSQLKNKLESFAVVNQYVFYANENHGWYDAPLTDSFNKIEAFLKANMN